MLVSLFLNNHSTDFENVDSFGKGDLSVLCGPGYELKVPAPSDFLHHPGTNDLCC